MKRLAITALLAGATGLILGAGAVAITSLTIVSNTVGDLYLPSR